MGFKAKLTGVVEAYDLITVVYAKHIIGGFDASEAGYTDQDTLIAFLVHAASLRCTGGMRNYRYQQYTENPNGNSASRILFVENPPIDSNMAVKVWVGRNTDYEFDDDHLATEHEDYEIWYEEGKIEFLSMLDDGVRNYQLQYYGGYQTGQVPQDLQEACGLIVADLFKMSDDKRHGLLSVGGAGETTSYTQFPIPPRAQDLLNRYIHPVSA